MNTRILLACVVVSIVTWLSIVANNAQQQEPTPPEAKVQELLVAKHDVLKERFDFIKANHEQGTAQYDEVLAAHEFLLKAELDLSQKKEQRLVLCQQRIENFRYFENRAIASFQAGIGKSDEKLLATANRIQAEIDFYREEAKPD